VNKIKKGDEVIVLAGKHKGRKGAVLKVLTKEDKIIVENVNMAKCHVKANPTRGTAGGIVEKEIPVHISNIAAWNPVTNKADKIGFRFLKDGRKVRYFKSNNEIIDT